MAKWTKESVQEVLEDNGLEIVGHKDLPHGVQLVLEDGSKVNVFNTGKINVQGKKDSDQKAIAEDVLSATAPKKTATGKTDSKKVFIVYGHDTDARNDLERLLLRFGLDPIVLGKLAPEGKTIIEALEANADVPYACVLLTPDDEGHPAGQPDKKRFRARQNVVLELGMFLAKLGRSNVAILRKGEVENPSDIGGLIWLPFKDSVDEAQNQLAGALKKAGLNINLDALLGT